MIYPMKKLFFIIAACLAISGSFNANAQSAISQLEQMSGTKINRPSHHNDFFGSFSQGLLGILLDSAMGEVQAAVTDLLSPSKPEPAQVQEPFREHYPAEARVAEPIAPHITESCPPTIISGGKEGCTFDASYPVPGDEGWFLEYRKTNETPVDHDFTVVYWEKEGINGVPQLKVMRSGFPQNMRNDYLFGHTVDGKINSSTKCYKIEKIIYND